MTDTKTVREALENAKDYVDRYGDSRKDAHYIEQFDEAIAALDRIEAGTVGECIVRDIGTLKTGHEVLLFKEGQNPWLGYRSYGDDGKPHFYTGCGTKVLGIQPTKWIEIKDLLRAATAPKNVEGLVKALEDIDADAKKAINAHDALCLLGVIRHRIRETLADYSAKVGKKEEAHSDGCVCISCEYSLTTAENDK